MKHSRGIHHSIATDCYRSQKVIPTGILEWHITRWDLFLRRWTEDRGVWLVQGKVDMLVGNC